MHTSKQAFVKFVAAALLITTGVLIGRWIPASVAHAESRQVAPREHFKSGGQVSIPILKEIAGTLRSIDGRLARVESSLASIRANTEVRNAKLETRTTPNVATPLTPNR